MVVVVDAVKSQVTRVMHSSAREGGKNRGCWLCKHTEGGLIIHCMEFSASDS